MRMISRIPLPIIVTSCRRRYGDCMYRSICEGEPSDRQRIINERFKIAEVWDISND